MVERRLPRSVRQSYGIRRGGIARSVARQWSQVGCPGPAPRAARSAAVLASIHSSSRHGAANLGGSRGGILSALPKNQEARHSAGLHVDARFECLPPFVTASAAGRFYFVGPTHLNSPGSGVAFRTTTSPFALIVSLNEPPPNHSGPCPSIGTNRPLLTHCRTSPFSSRIFD